MNPPGSHSRRRTPLTLELYREIKADELGEAAELLDRLIEAPELCDFLTLSAYHQLTA